MPLLIIQRLLQKM